MLTGMLLVATAAPASELGEVSDRWLPSIGPVFGATFQQLDADVTSQICRGCTIPDPAGGEEPLRPFVDGEDTDATPYVGISLELMSPELPIPGRPRVFGAGEVLGRFGVSRKVALEGDPGEIRSPLPPGAEQNQPYTEENALGQGSEAVVEAGDVAYAAQLGLAFPVEILDRDLLIKPSIAWINFDFDLEGLVSNADCQDFGFGNNVQNRCNTSTVGGPGFLRATTLAGKETENFHGIGPGIDVEIEVARKGPFVVTAYAGGRFYRVIGDRDVTITAGPEAVSDVLGDDELAARFEYEVDEWVHRVGVGFRLVWLGLD